MLPILGIALNGTSSVLYGSVPVLVEPEKRTRALRSSSTPAPSVPAQLAPILYGFIGDTDPADAAASSSLAGLVVLLDRSPLCCGRLLAQPQSPSTVWTSVSAATRRRISPQDARTKRNRPHPAACSSTARSSSAKPPSDPIRTSSGAPLAIDEQRRHRVA